MSEQSRPVTVEAQGWTWRHGGRINPAIAGLDLRIEPGERVLLLGPSGAGKSTLLHGLAGVLGDDDDAGETGELLINGEPAGSVRGRAGLLQQDPESQVVLSRIGDDVAFGPENLAVPREQIWPRVRRALDDVDLQLPLDHPTSELSGGQKQRLGLAGLLAMEPGLLLLDEPTANLDPDGVHQVRDAVVRSLDRTGATLVVVEHRVSVWAPVVDRIVVLEPGGGVAHDGPTQEVLARWGDELAAAGIWVPGVRPVGAPDPRPAGEGSGELLLRADQLSVSRKTIAARRRRKNRPVDPADIAASGIDCHVRAGEALTITGANGTGKSTLALTLAGLLPAVEGAVVAEPVLARGVGSDPYRWSASSLIGRIGTVFQEPEHQFVASTVREELSFGPSKLQPGESGYLPPEEVDAKVDELLERLRLTKLAAANPFTLSGGEKRRLSVATVLAASPDVVVLDEPTFGQDARTWAELATMLVELLDAGRSIISVTHDAEFSAVLGGTKLELARDASGWSTVRESRGVEAHDDVRRSA